MYKVSLNWEENMKFRGFGADGHEVTLDAGPDSGGLGAGMRPTQLLLISLGGCAGISLLHILNKMRIDYETFDVEIEAEREDAPPYVFTSISVQYIISSSKLNQKKLEETIRISERYCTVYNMLVKACPIRFSYQLNGVNYQVDDESVSEE